MKKLILLSLFLSSLVYADNFSPSGGGGGGTTDTVARSTATTAKNTADTTKTELDTHKADNTVHVTSAEKAKFHDKVKLDPTSNPALTITSPQTLKLTLPNAATIDSSLSTTSTNALENKAIKTALDAKQNKADIVTTIRDLATATDTNYTSEKSVRTELDNIKNIIPVSTVAEMTKNNQWYELTADDLPAEKGTYWTDSAGTPSAIITDNKITGEMLSPFSNTFAGLPAIPAGTGKYSTILLQDDVGTGTAQAPQYPEGIYLSSGGNWVFSGKSLDTSIATLTDQQIQDKTDTTSGVIVGGKMMFDWHQSTKAAVGDIVAGTDATVKGHTSEQLNKEIVTLIRQTSLPFWDQNYAAYGDLSVTVGNLSSKYVIGSNGVVYVAQIDQVPAGTDPTTDNGSNWKPLNTSNSHTLLYNSTMTVDIKQIGLKKEQRAFLYPFDGQKAGYKIKPNNTFGKTTVVNGTLATPDGTGSIAIPASDYSYIWQNFEDPDATSGTTYVVTASSGAKEKSITVNYPTLQATLDSTLDDGNTVRSFISTPLTVGVAHNSLETRILTDMTLADVKTALGSTAQIELRNIDGISSQDPATIPAGIYLIMNQSTTAQSWLFDQKYAGGEKTVLGVVHKVAEKILNWDIGGGNTTYTLSKSEFDISACSSIKFLIRDVDNPSRRWALHELHLLSSTNDFLFDTYNTGYIAGTVSKTNNSIVAAEHNRNIILEKIWCYAETTVSSDHIVYSLLEKDTGDKWVDGKKIYRRSFTDTISNGGTVLDINIGFYEVIKSDVMIKAANGTQIPALYKDDSATDRAYYWTSGGHVYLKNFWAGGGATNLIATFEYTK